MGAVGSGAVRTDEPAYADRGRRLGLLAALAGVGALLADIYL